MARIPGPGSHREGPFEQKAAKEAKGWEQERARTGDTVEGVGEDWCRTG